MASRKMELIFDDGPMKMEKCPVCESGHEYTMSIVKRPVQAYLTPDKETDEVITRVDTSFVCPDREKEFEKIVVVVHRIYERIDQVTSEPA